MTFDDLPPTVLINVMGYDDLISRCSALAKLRPDFVPALDALIEAESVELYQYWLERRKGSEVPAMIILNSNLIEG